MGMVGAFIVNVLAGMILLRLSALWARAGTMTMLKAFQASSMAEFVSVVYGVLVSWLLTMSMQRETAMMYGGYPRGPSASATNPVDMARRYLESLPQALFFSNNLIYILVLLVLIRAIAVKQVAIEGDGTPVRFSRACLIAALQTSMMMILWMIGWTVCVTMLAALAGK
jgi:hypothetical protein